MYKDLPHPPTGFLSPLDSGHGSSSPSQISGRMHYAYRAPDGSNYNPLIPGLGKVGSPYARSVPSTRLTPKTSLPEPCLIFDTLLKRDKFVPHPDGISSLFFSFADLIIHSIFKTDSSDYRINQTSSYLDLSVLYGNSEEELAEVRAGDGTGKLKPDCFADIRLLMMPPASCALLVLLNRNHNVRMSILVLVPFIYTHRLFQFIAQKLLDINESGEFKHPKHLHDNEKKLQDDEIFHRTRLVNCGYFMHIILGGIFDLNAFGIAFV